MASTQPNPQPGMLTGLVPDSPGFGRAERVCRRLWESSDPVAIWVDSAWVVDASPLSLALSESTDLDFVWGETGREMASRTEADRLWKAPRAVPALAIRPALLSEASQPDFGAPDAVLDASAGWAITTLLALKGLHGRAVALPGARALGEAPESIDRLTPAGIAWLVSQAQGWVNRVPDPGTTVTVVTHGSVEAAR